MTIYPSPITVHGVEHKAIASYKKRTGSVLILNTGPQYIHIDAAGSCVGVTVKVRRP